MKKKWIPQAIAILMLLWGLIPTNPYAYYVIMRWVCCAVFVYLAVRAWEMEKIGWVWGLGVTAAMYNPILRVPTNREVWSIVNLVSIGLAIASIFVLKSAETDT